MILLGYGPKFALPFESNREVPYFKIIADLESILKLETDESLQAANRNRFTNIIQNHLNKRKNGLLDPTADSVNSFLMRAYHISKKFIRDNPDIYIVPADKGNKTVIMKKEEYEEKMKTLIDDDDTYERIDTDWTNRVQTKNNQLVNALHDQKMIDQKTRSTLITYNATCPRIYGLPKIHKPESYVLVSFDVVSLFTCIPRDLIMAAVRNNWNSIEKNTTIKNIDIFSNLIDFNLSSSYFVYRGTYFRQKSGTAMGNPLSPALADLVMETLLDYVIEAIDIPIPFIKKYVDDLITALPADKIEYVKRTFNTYDPHIQFTCEVENENRLPYLDMVLIRTGEQQIVTDWYRKPISSGHLPQQIHVPVQMVKRKARKKYIDRFTT
ncbi:uncharacterized protein LOC128736152 [Sabethes cyaneus]|uniref:uncharacterized protein LOC128736152 n=1 Tax=Sabethes cyaneus TaxID=53552 RepID=UPI00237EB869|nr:uncharacterized protein LOC128736152 [Sabethes cyaneus]